LVHLIADAWHNKGDTVRADVLYASAFEISRKDEFNPVAAADILHDWALLKIDVGDPQRAREIAQTWVTLARAHYRRDNGSATYGDVPAWKLIEALEFQATVIEKTINPQAARAIREEAGFLLALRKPLPDQPTR
jgi:hypothetical protein